MEVVVWKLAGARFAVNSLSVQGFQRDRLIGDETPVLLFSELLQPLEVARDLSEDVLKIRLMSQAGMLDLGLEASVSFESTQPAWHRPIPAFVASVADKFGAIELIVADEDITWLLDADALWRCIPEAELEPGQSRMKDHHHVYEESPILWFELDD